MLKDVLIISLLSTNSRLSVPFVNLNTGYLDKNVKKFLMKTLIVLSSYKMTNVDNVKKELIISVIVKYALLFNKLLDNSLNDSNYIKNNF